MGPTELADQSDPSGVDQWPRRGWWWEPTLRSTALQIPQTPAGGRRLLLTARTSLQAGAAALKAVDQDMAGCVAAFADLYGPDFSHLLPGRAELKATIAASPKVKSFGRDGRKFSHRFVELDFLATDGVYFLYVLGSGVKTDVELRQPALERLAVVAKRIKPGAVFTKQILRLGRDPWAFGPTVAELNDVGGFIGDADRGLRKMESLEALMLFFQATEGQNEAAKISVRTRRGMTHKTSRQVVDGVAHVGAMPPLPPGLAILRQRGVTALGPSIMAFDSPAYLPDPETIAYGMPDVRTPDGELVDQVQLVRWALSVLGTRPSVGIGRELIRRQFSTAGARRRTDATAAFTDPQAAIDAVVRHLEFYETGKLTISLGEDFPNIPVTGWIPPDGPWAPPERFNQIRTWLAICAELEQMRANTTFGGLPVTVNGEAGILLAYKAGTERLGETAYRVIDRTGPTAKAVGDGVPIPHSLIADAIVAGLSAAGDAALRIVPMVTSAPPEFHDHLHRLEVRRASVEAGLRSLSGQLDERDESGRPIVTGALLVAKTKAYNDAAADLDTIDGEIVEVTRQIAVAEQQSRAKDAPVLAQHLLRMVATLKDPSCLEYQYLWRAAIRDARITTEVKVAVGLQGHKITFAGEIRAGDAVTQVAIPFGASIDTLTPRVERRVRTVIEEMRAGVPALSASPPRIKLLLPLVARALVGTTPYGLMQCADPRIVRLTMARCFPAESQDVTDATVAAAFDEPLALVERVRVLWHTGRLRRWRLPGAPILVALHLSAAVNGGRAVETDVVGRAARSVEVILACLRLRDLRQEWTRSPDGGWTITPCRCGSVELAPCLIREIDGYLCLECWHDRSGVEWPADPYAHLVDDFASWVAAGIVVPLVGTSPFGTDAHPKTLKAVGAHDRF